MIHRISVKNIWQAPSFAGRSLRTAVRIAIRNEQKPFACRVEICLSNDHYIRDINVAIRGINRATDVLSFPYIHWAAGEQAQADPEDGRVFLGEIIISMNHAKKQAAAYGHSLEREICYLGVHGALHLLGYDHETETDKQNMRRREEAVLDAMRLGR